MAEPSSAGAYCLCKGQFSAPPSKSSAVGAIKPTFSEDVFVATSGEFAMQANTSGLYFFSYTAETSETTKVEGYKFISVHLDENTKTEYATHFYDDTATLSGILKVSKGQRIRLVLGQSTEKTQLFNITFSAALVSYI